MAISRTELDALLARKDVTFQELQRLPPDTAPLIMDIFRHDQTPWNERKRRTALEALGLIGSEQAVDLLIGVTADPAIEMWLREAAVRALGNADHPKAFAYLEETARHPDFGFRKSAIAALAASPNPNARQTLELVQASDSDDRLRQHAAELLATLPTLRTLDTTLTQRPSSYLE